VRVKAILNPWADRGRALRLKEPICTWARPLGGIEVEVTRAAGHAQRLARQASDEGYDVIAAAGGDGTVHEVANGLLAAGAAQPPALGIIPIGSGNDYAYGLGLAGSPQIALQRLYTGKPRRVDVASLEDDHGRSRYVCNGVGIGFDAAVAIESLKITRIYGFPMYVLAALRTILFRYQSPQFQLRFDEERVAQRALLLAVGVGPRVGGGFRLTPEATFDDAMIDSCLVNPVSRLTMLVMLLRVMRGSHVTSRHVTMRRGHTLELASSQPLPIHIDGEIFARPDDDVRGLTIRCLPRAMAVMT
jgi:YegS/Rv2252/BmrU family lipid kinase